MGNAANRHRSNGARAVREQYDGAAASYDDRWNWYVHASIRETLKRIPALEGNDARVLDLGCGTGALLERLPRESIRVGADLSVGMLAVANERLPSDVHFAAADAGQLPFASNSFDLVVSSSSFHYWPEPEPGLTEIHRCLKSGGWIVITDWCDDFLSCKLCDLWLQWVDPAHRRIFNAAALTKFLEHAGFRGIQLDRYRISVIWGLMTAIARK